MTNAPVLDPDEQIVTDLKLPSRALSGSCRLGCGQPIQPGQWAFCWAGLGCVHYDCVLALARRAIEAAQFRAEYGERP